MPTSGTWILNTFHCIGGLVVDWCIGYWKCGEDINRRGPQLWPPGVGGWGEGRVRDMAILINIVMINFARD